VIHVDVDRLFHALGDPTRRAILDRLSERPASVTHLAERLGVTPTAIGQHLQVLQESGLARTKKVGRVRTCAIAPEGFATLEQWVAAHRTLWDQRLDRLGDLLAED
jgi:DNA-binding transcriptional ArsR family regulator